MCQRPPVIRHAAAEYRPPLCSSHSPGANLAACTSTCYKSTAVRHSSPISLQTNSFASQSDTPNINVLPLLLFVEILQEGKKEGKFDAFSLNSFFQAICTGDCFILQIALHLWLI